MTCKETLAVSSLYLSGELDAEQAAEFRAHLGACPACAGELERLTELDARIRDAVLGEPVDSAGVETRVRQAITPRRSWWIGVAAAIVGAAVLSVYTYRAAQPPPRECTAAATDHHREVVDARPRNWLSDPAAVEALAARQGIDGAAVSQIMSAGLRLEHGKICRLDGNLFLHLVFWRDGQQVSIFLRKGAEGPSDTRTVHSGAEDVAYFETSRVKALVVADAPSNHARAIAQAVQKTL
jgi:anti-sigma factor RsiW